VGASEGGSGLAFVLGTRQGDPNCGDQVLPIEKNKIKKSSWSLNSSMRYCCKRMLDQVLALKKKSWGLAYQS
jgi:hypothetical protein